MIEPIYHCPASQETWQQYHDDTLIDRLEQGQVICCNALPFTLHPDELCLLTPTLSDGKHKNISIHPNLPGIGGARHLDIMLRDRLQALLKRFYQQSLDWTHHFFPE